MSERKKLPPNRLVVRPADASDEPEAKKQIATDLANWVVAQRERVQAAAKERRAKESSRPASSPVPMAAKGK